MTFNNKTVSRQKSLSRQHCKIYDVRGCHPRKLADDRRSSKSSFCYITNHLITGPSGDELLRFSENKIHCFSWHQSLSVKYSLNKVMRAISTAEHLVKFSSFSHVPVHLFTSK